MSTGRVFATCWYLPTVSILGFLFFLALEYQSPDIYFRLMGILIKVPVKFPFADWEWNAAAIRCWGKGVNVYVENPCFTFWPNAIHNYSPLWLRLPFLGTEAEVSLVVAFGLCLIFFLSLASLPVMHSSAERGMMALATFSSSTLLAVERGNTELLMFVMLLAAVHLANRSIAWRMLGYAVIAFAGLLKFYPFVALWVALKERFVVVLSVGLASITALASLVVLYYGEMLLMAANLPKPSYWVLQYGAGNLAVGLGVTAGKILEKIAAVDPLAAREFASIIAQICQIILVVAVIGLAGFLLWRSSLTQRLQAIPALSRDLLLAGGAVIVGCHFAGQSVVYRGIFFLIILPGLAAILRQGRTEAGTGPAIAGLARGTIGAILLVLWAPAVDSILWVFGMAERIPYQLDAYVFFPASPAGYGLWLAKELAWWWIIAVLMAMLAATAISSPAWSVVFKRSGPAATNPPYR